MAVNIEHQNKGELVANCDRLQNDEVVVTTPVESRIMSIRGNQIMIDRDLAELYSTKNNVNIPIPKVPMGRGWADIYMIKGVFVRFGFDDR